MHTFLTETLLRLLAGSACLLLAALPLTITADVLGETAWPKTAKAAIDDAPPYRIIDGDEISGIYIEIYELVMEKLDVETNYIEVPFPRALKMLQDGKADLMLGPIYSDSRDKYIDYSIPAFPPVKKIFLVNHQSNAIRDYANLQGKIIAVQRGSSYFRRFDQDTRLNKIALNDYAQALCMLKADRVDVVIIPEPIATILLDKYEITFIRSPLYVPGDTSYIAISAKSPLRHFSERIRQALDAVKKSKKYQEIFERYLHWDSKVEAHCPLT